MDKSGFHMCFVETMTWTKLDHCKGDLPGPRTCSSLVSLDNKLYLYGGGLWSSDEQKWTNKYNDIVCFDIERSEWKKIEAKGRKLRKYYVYLSKDNIL
jgi:hypothetical protein